MLSVPGNAVDQADADQKQQRGGQVDHDVVQPGLARARARAVQRQAVRRGEQQLEKDEQIEEIARQEGAIEAHQQELEQRMEMRARAMPAREREHHRGRRQDARQEQHQSGQAVQRRARSRTAPANRRGDTLRLMPAGLASDIPSKAIGDADEGEGRSDIDRGLEVAVPVSAKEKHAGAGDERQHHGRDDQVIGQRGSRLRLPAIDVVGPRQAPRCKQNDEETARSSRS